MMPPAVPAFSAAVACRIAQIVSMPVRSNKRSSTVSKPIIMPQDLPDFMADSQVPWGVGALIEKAAEGIKGK
jgi:hypothetical protein